MNIIKTASLGFLLCLRAFAQGPSGPAGETAFGLRVPAPGPDGFADEVLQQAIDQAAAAGGGTVILGAGDFKLSRHADDETVIIKSNITLRGQGHATHIYLDPKTPPNDLRYFPVRIGSSKVPAHNVVIEHLRYTGNDKAIGGGSIMGFNARLDEKESLLLSCDNITVRHCWIYDAKQAVGCTKPATAMSGLFASASSIARCSGRGSGPASTPTPGGQVWSCGCAVVPVGPCAATESADPLTH